MMDRIISKLTLHQEEVLSKPFTSTDKLKEAKKKLLRAYEEAKMFKEYHNTAQCMYWIGELQFDAKLRRQFSGHMLAQSRKVYALCKDNPKWIKHMSCVPLEDWTRTSIQEARLWRPRVRQVLDGARTDVGENVN